MNYFEVFVKLVNHGREIGRTCIQLQVSTPSPFMAAMKASNALESRYGQDVICRVLRVSEISEREFFYLRAA